MRVNFLSSDAVHAFYHKTSHTLLQSDRYIEAEAWHLVSSVWIVCGMALLFEPSFEATGLQ